MNTKRWLLPLVLLAISIHSSSAAYPSVRFGLTNVVFDDGGQATGGFDFNFDSKRMPLPQFYNVQIVTSPGSMLPGSDFSVTGVCYNSVMKKRVCAPGDNFLMYVETGTYGEPGYTRFQFATFFAPNDEIGQNGLLDPAYSYEMACTDSGCIVRHVISGEIRYASQQQE